MTSETAAVEEKPSATPTVALALGGGGARGLAHIHVIEVLDELGIKPVVIAGSSIGAIMGAAMASGMSGADIRDYTLSTLGDRVGVVNKLWSLRPSSIGEAMAGGLPFGRFNLERVLKAFLPKPVPSKFGELKIPLKVLVTDYYGHREVVVEEGELYPALAASAALPAVFSPVRVNGRIMIDGGFMNPVPFEHVMGRADIVIGIDVAGVPEGNADEMPTMFDSLYGATQLMMQANISLRLKLHTPDILLRPTVSHFRVLDFLRAREVLADSIGIRDELKRAIETEIARH
ncbi:patatin-like phospholipase family protein [Rhizobiaceae bacterium n13]|uniref:Patatin-like phospholipase family protein n=1 Tax=Ferirhizobium litorale TaxID=2927786 RepID=A0AAE3U1J9_9HYPH|nr:patatin-like phospholipase family protein [Fererhizobium litorale]MDI7861541.1 patatin-like phospholipase family protein [Fererhizobium litorale]MDI7921687.1 patatin-like phospholipase family protein [Fererhizobium litorale]